MAQGMGSNPMAQGMGGTTNPQANGPMGLMQNMIFNNLYRNNPQFKQFADSMQGKNPEEAFQEQGLDYNQFRNVGPEQVRNMFGL